MNEAVTSHPPAVLSGVVSTPPTGSSGALPAALAPFLQGLSAEQWQDARARLEVFRTEGEKFVRENPGRAVLYAVGAGFVLGLLLRR